MMARKRTKLISSHRFFLNLLIISVAHLKLVRCQEITNQTSATASINSTLPPTSKPEVDQDSLNSTNASLLISDDEFVDFTEAPVILFDGTSNEANSNNKTSTSANLAPMNKSSGLPSSEVNATAIVTTIATNEKTTTSQPETTTLSGDEYATTSPEDLKAEIESDENSESDEGKEDEKFKPPQNVSQYMDYIEHLFHDLRHQITDLFEPHLPQLIRTSQMVQLSGSCSYDMLRMALALRQFEPWALRMIDSSGKVPEGIFEGSFTALGSYDECLNTVFKDSSPGEQPFSGSLASPPPSPSAQQGSSQATANSLQPPTQGKYCLVNVSPYLPPKPPADRVERLFQEEANRRNYTKDDQFSRLSPMFYYMRFRIGVCVPSTCLESDMQSISEALSSSLKLNITVANCQIKQTSPLTNHQLAGGFIFGLVVALVLGATLIDFYRRKLTQARVGSEKVVMFKVIVKDSKLAVGTGITGLGGELPVICRTSSVDESHLPRTRDLLRKHWSWMSFSMLANFKLHFERPQTRQRASMERSAPIIKCLNGIRVLSLCWVIIANSYITLDPRATKRLTKTREAPKDFLFQMVVQASLAIETFFFLSGVLMSLSFSNRFKPNSSSPSQVKDRTDRVTIEKSTYLLQWLRFYVHRYIRMTPATMLVIAFSMFAYRYGDGPLWSEATEKAHQSCSQNWWRHLLHVANFIDTRQMCFIHYWYIAADMQLFLFAPVLMFLIYHRRRVGYALVTVIGFASMVFVFYTTYARNLPPTLLFYNSDPESRREFGNTIMTKPLTHALPYMVGMLLGKRLHESVSSPDGATTERSIGHKSLTAFLGSTAAMIALVEVFLPYKWNNSHLPTRFLAAIYAALFRFAWALALAYLVLSCRHERNSKCRDVPTLRRRKIMNEDNVCSSCQSSLTQFRQTSTRNCSSDGESNSPESQASAGVTLLCMCAYGGNLVNRLLSLNIFTHLSKLSFVAYLIHLPLMSVFVGQTRGLFAFSHTLVIHLALSYLVMTFLLSFVLVHVIEFPFITFESYLFNKLLNPTADNNDDGAADNEAKLGTGPTTRANSDNYGNKFNVVKFSNGTTDNQSKFSELEAVANQRLGRHHELSGHNNHDHHHPCGANNLNRQHKFVERL